MLGGGSLKDYYPVCVNLQMPFKNAVLEHIEKLEDK